MTETKKKDFSDLMFEVIIPKIEIISIVLIAISILFKLLHLQGTNEMFMISMSTYAVICYLSAFQKNKFEGVFNQFIVKLGGIASAVLVIGTLFLILSLKGGQEMFMIGVPAFILAFIAILYKNTNTESEEYKKILIRHSKTFVIVAVIYLVTFYLY